ncbi:MAG TPA: AAA family ATPase, partial [Gemmatimonadales bacterium]|nr:AAA family ATPase [Gemmatimonadales bacterium]
MTATQTAPAPAPNDDVRQLARLVDAITRLRGQVAQRIVGQDEVIDGILTAILSGGHALLIGVPGLAKTLMVQTVAEALELSFNRVQFTPDLMPSDITGTDIIEEDLTTGKRAFRFVHGPIFANVVLADEINRTPPKTQAALLEAMQEQQVTVGGQRHLLPNPFFVLA